MKFTNSKFIVTAASVACLVISACAPATTTAPVVQVDYGSLPTETLWRDLSLTESTMEMMLIEAELGARGQEAFGAEYIGRRTSGTVGNQLYARTSTASQATTSTSFEDQDCSDFSSSASAQRFFLSDGGPISDRHNLDGDGDGNACEWGRTLVRSAARYKPKPVVRQTRRPAIRSSYSSNCHVGPRGGTYTITASGAKDYDGC